MITRTIPRTQEQLPVIGTGSWQTFDVGSNAGARAAPIAVLDSFFKAGGRLIDSSPMYGDAEAVIGDSLTAIDSKETPFIATKVWTSGEQAGIRQMEDSMRKLRTRCIDLMQVHNLVDVDIHLKTLAQWKLQGRVRYLGVTHYTANAHAAVEKAMRNHKLDFVQINYSLAEREAERSLLPHAADLGVAVIINRPFAGGTILRRLRKLALPEWAAELHCTSWAQLALKFVISHPAVTCVIPATSNPAHLQDYVKAGFAPMPDTEMRMRIAASIANV